MQAGPPLIATAGQDGGVRVWDARQPAAPAAAFLPAPGAAAPDAWCVAVGNAHAEGQACVLAGYAGGELRLLDLAAGRVRWETNVGAGVCGVQVRRYLVHLLPAGCRCCRLAALHLSSRLGAKPRASPPPRLASRALFISPQFDRRNIAMNKFVATCLESRLCLYDARTQHPSEGFAGSW